MKNVMIYLPGLDIDIIIKFGYLLGKIHGRALLFQRDNIDHNISTSHYLHKS